MRGVMGGLLSRYSDLDAYPRDDHKMEIEKAGENMTDELGEGAGVYEDSTRIFQKGSLSLSFFFSPSLSFSLSLFPSLPLSLPHSLSPSLSLSLSLSLPSSLSLSLSLPECEISHSLTSLPPPQRSAVCTWKSCAASSRSTAGSSRRRFSLSQTSPSMDPRRTRRPHPPHSATSSPLYQNTSRSQKRSAFLMTSVSFI